ncbi:MAG: L-threonylcarbamoyladenylate synthase [Chloroflexia bacterium]|jgi:L-threonylcarbamoyladenylate synthase|nr:L-threonylcarbamoyladenylate synthase [Chloroflexia bacterium]
MPTKKASPETWREAREIIERGGLVAFPTDTVYGLGCDPYNVSAIERLYEAKGRDLSKALPLLLSGAHRVGEVARSLPETAKVLAEEFWPGALTLVVLKQPKLPEALGGGDTIAVRVPRHDELLAFIETCGGALAVSSANLSGQVDAHDASEAAAYLEDRVDLIVDGGPSPGGVPSSVVDCTLPVPRLLREGAISEEEIRAVLASSDTGPD